MEKMRMESVDLQQANVEKIAALFPNCVTEALDEERSTAEKKVYRKTVNFELLKQMLSDEVLEGDEAYEFTWVGKKAAIVEANKPIRKTLRPCPEESVDWDSTENLYIEGDNLEVLKLLQESYLGKVKMIYIDPPYNTGKDVFVYFDQFDMDQDAFDEGMSRYDENGNLNFVQNSQNNARFHSAWCSMIYPCLLLARNVLSDDGVIYISIDNHEIDNMLKICDEIFGIDNRIACIVNVNNPKGRSDEKNVATAHEYLAVYQKRETVLSGFKPEDNVLRRYNKTDNKGNQYRHIDLRKTGDSDRREDRPNMFYYFFFNQQTGEFYPSFEDTCPEGWVKIQPLKDDGSEGRWRVGIETAINRSEILEPTYMAVKKRWTVMERDYLSDDLRVKATTAWTYKDLNSERGTEQFIDLGFDKNVFPRPKPLGTVLRPLELSTNEGDIVLDFFSGSATTAHAVMAMNAIDKKKRKFIMVQLPEVCTEDSDACKEGFANICEIGKERIRRAGKKIKEEARVNETCSPDSSMRQGKQVPLTHASPLALDTGFRVFKLDSSNMKDVYYGAGGISQSDLIDMTFNIKEDRTDLDLLFGCLLEWGLPLSLPYTSEKIEGYTVHTYNDDDLIACFEANIPESVIKTIAKRKPLRAVFRDSSFADDSAKISVGEIFKVLSPDTRIKVL